MKNFIELDFRLKVSSGEFFEVLGKWETEACDRPSPGRLQAYDLKGDFLIDEVFQIEDMQAIEGQKLEEDQYQKFFPEIEKEAFSEAEKQLSE